MNKIPKGYKQTEVGAITNNGKWKFKKLQEMSELITKGTTSTSLGKNYTKNGKIIKDKVIIFCFGLI